MLRAILPVLSAAESRAAAVEVLVREHQAGIRAFLRALGVGEAWVDDLAQETFLVAYRKIEDWDRGRDPGPWLRGIARHLAANERRKTARRSRLLGGGLADLLIEYPGPETETEPTSSPAELLDALQTCLQELPEAGRELLRRRYAEGALAEELAAQLQTRGDALRQKLLRLRVLVKACVERRMKGVWA